MTTPSTPASGNDAASADERTLVATRLLTATPEQIYAAFIAANRLARWWGPNGFRNTFHEFDPRPGGTWRFVMHAPNGADYPNESRFEALVPGQRIVIRHVSGPHFTLTVTLAPEGTGTRLTWRQAFETARELEAVRAFAGRANEENLDRLEAELARTSP